MVSCFLGYVYRIRGGLGEGRIIKVSFTYIDAISGYSFVRLYKLFLDVYTLNLSCLDVVNQPF